MTSSIEHSLKARIRSIALEKRVAPASLWTNLVLERFLVRLSHSKYRENFILKGGVLLSNYVEINRHTQDLDFSVQKLDANQLRPVIEDIAATSVEDGFRFTDIELRDLLHDHMEYSGVRATMTAWYGKIRFKVQVDIGFGDRIQPIEHCLTLISGSKGALFENEVNLNCYPIEFIFAEKLESVVYRGKDNSRIKDFHDLYFLTQNSTSLGQILETVIRSVFDHRNTQLSLPVRFTEDQMIVFQSRWAQHLQTLPANDAMPTEFADALSAINLWLEGHTTLCKV